MHAVLLRPCRRWPDKLSCSGPAALRMVFAQGAVLLFAAGSPRYASCSGRQCVRRTTSNSHVVIISASDETSRELGQYLAGAGVRAATRTELSHEHVTASGRAVVLFPDDFAAEDAIEHLRAARAAQPAARLVVVTAHPQRFERAVARDGSGLGLIALPRPAFGWAILEAIRSDS